MKRTLLLLKKFFILICFSSMCLAMEEILDTTISSVDTTQNILAIVKKKLGKIKVKDGQLDFSKVLSVEETEQLTEFLNNNPEFVQILQEAAFEKKSLKTQVAQFISSLPENLWYQCRGAFGGFAGACLLMLSINALYPDTLCEMAPQGITAGIAIPGFLFIVAKLYNWLKLPEDFKNILIAKGFNLATRLAPALVCSRKYQVNTNITEEMRESFQELLRTLTQEQKEELSAPSVLVQAQIDPRVLLDEIGFLNSLDKKQVKQLYCYFYHTIPDAINKNFESFAQELSVEQRRALKPSNKLLLASFNPGLLFAKCNQEFIDLLQTSNS